MDEWAQIGRSENTTLKRAQTCVTSKTSQLHTIPMLYKSPNVTQTLSQNLAWKSTLQIHFWTAL